MLRPAFGEVLRYFTPVQNVAQRAVSEVEIGDRTVAAGDTILMSWASANSDEDVFEDADRVVIDRSLNRHIAMGRGKHFYLGSFQARKMFEVMMNAVLDRFPDYLIMYDKAVRYPSIRNVNGWVKMPALFTSGEKRAADQSLVKGSYLMFNLEGKIPGGVCGARRLQERCLPCLAG